MVIKPESYPWSSCATRLNIDKNSELDLDECYLALSSSEYKRKVIYKEFLSQGTPEKEQQFLKEACQRNQLSGNAEFINEIAERVGVRVECRSRGRSKKV